MNCINTHGFRVLLTCMASLTLAFFVSPDGSWGQPGSPNPRIALLISNADYPDASAPLRPPTKSIHILADELRRNGFHVDARENLSKQDLLRAVDEFKHVIEPGSAALFFFSGYGLQADRQSFVIPVDAQIWTEADVARDGVEHRIGFRRHEPGPGQAGASRCVEAQSLRAPVPGRAGRPRPDYGTPRQPGHVRGSTGQGGG